MNEASADRVECYSGHTYAQEPRVVVWRGRRFAVVQIEQRWRAPEGPAFLVETEADLCFKLCYDEREDAWTIEPLAAFEPEALEAAGRERDGFEGGDSGPGNSKPVSA
jgi:hypothetical protein